MDVVDAAPKTMCTLCGKYESILWPCPSCEETPCQNGDCFERFHAKCRELNCNKYIDDDYFDEIKAHVKILDRRYLLN